MGRMVWGEIRAIVRVMRSRTKTSPYIMTVVVRP